MRFKKGLYFFLAGIISAASACSDNPSQPPVSTYGSPQLASFDIIKNVPVSAKEKKIGIINFNEFSRIYVHNYYPRKSAREKQKILAKIQAETSNLKYSTRVTASRRPPVIMHWTDGSNAMGAIRTLFKQQRNMAEGVIGVDYVVTEPLKHPDYPARTARAYAVNFSGSDVATTWYHVPGQFRNTEDRKYNSAINIEITGWRFLQNPKGKKGDFGKKGSLGIRETFNKDFNRLENKYKTYPTVLKLVNYLAEKHKFAGAIDGFSPEKEISRELNKTGTIYLDGPLSRNLKGHGLIAMEHSLKYGGRYRELRRDFTAKELLVLYSDLKGYRRFISGKPPLKT